MKNLVCCSLVCRKVVSTLPCSRESQSVRASFGEASHMAHTHDMSVEPGLALVWSPPTKKRMCFRRCPLTRIGFVFTFCHDFHCVGNGGRFCLMMFALGAGMSCSRWCLVPVLAYVQVSLPVLYNYVTIKAKCRQNGKQTCNKVGHSFAEGGFIRCVVFSEAVACHPPWAGHGPSSYG